MKRLTHPERVLWPELGLTKLDLANYYQAVAPVMLPLVAGRPLTLLRVQGSVAQRAFFQRHPTRGMSEAIHGVSVREAGEMKTYLTVVDADGLRGLVQMGAVEIHAWGSRAPDVEHPDLLTFDFDPDPSVPWERTVRAAHELRARLEKLELQSFAKTTGGKGVHVVVPLAPELDWDQAKSFARLVCERMVRESPGEYLTSASKAARKGKIFLDYLRNGHAASAVCAYSARARPNATVATPVSWDELTPRLDPGRFDLKSVPRRLARLGRDPWQGSETRQSLDPAQLETLLE